jgi:hypothetical protein
MPLLLAVPALLAGDSPSIGTAAYLEVEALEVGGSYEIVVDVHFPEEVVTSKAGVPAPFLQLDVPPSVKLQGRVLTTHEELAANEFIQEPFERLLEESVSMIPFELIAEPAVGETIGLNLVAYVSAGDGSEPYFFRRRLELPVAGAAEAVVAETPKSNWGTDAELLQIGDRVTPFSLPLANGVEVNVAEWLGKKNLILTTYRAHW